MPRGCIVLIGAAVLLFLTLPALFDIAVDWLWFDSQQLASVYTTQLSAKLITFFVAAALAAIFLLVNLLIARRNITPRQLFEGQQLTISPGQFRLILWAVGIVLGIFFGLSASGRWETVLRFLNGSSFGSPDPVFNEDIGFYMFSLPFYDALRSWLTTLIFFTIVVVAAVYISGSRLSEGGGMTINLPSILGGREPVTIPFSVPPAMRVHLSVLAAIYLALFAVGYRLDQFNLLYSDHQVLFGADYTDVNARLVGNWILLVVASLSAVLLLLNIRFRTIRLLVGAVGLWILAAILVGLVYPSIIQNFVVNPSQLSLEQPYITNNITATRAAFNLNSIEVRPYNIQPLSRADITASPETMSNVRLWDYGPLNQTYNQRQTLETYYDFRDIDIDRYTINGRYRQVMLSARELNTANLPAQARSWVNQRLQYTHGYGIAMNPVNEIGSSGQPNFIVGGVPPTSTVGIAIPRPEIYFGQNDDRNNYIIVGTSQEEFNYRTSNADARSTYTGTAGVRLDSFFTKALFAYHFGDGNLLLSGYINDNSRIIFNRNTQHMVNKVAPFLLYDGDPYIALVDGRLVWIQDAYTYSSGYPYSRPFTDPNNDSVSFNYIRNSVKVTIDAYNGSMTFYAFDESDPLLRTYRSIFPGLFAPASAMSADLRAHLRYPEYMFNAQAELYRTYHMTDPVEFYNQADAWDIPNESSNNTQVNATGNKSNGQLSTRMEAYYIIMRIPGDPREEFLLMLPYTPKNKNNMVAWMAAKSDGADYGKISVINFPRDLVVDGPEQVGARINQDAEISQLHTLLGQQGSNVIFGNLLVIPVGQSLLYVQPLYVQATQTGAQPNLTKVLVASGTQVAVADNLQAAMDNLFAKIAAYGGGLASGGGSTTPSTTPTAGTPVTQPTTTLPTPIAQGTPGVNLDANLPTDQLIVAAQNHYRAAQAALAKTPPDWVTYGREQDALRADLDLLAQRLLLTPTPVK